MEYVWLSVLIILLLGGGHMVIWPDVTMRLDPEYLENNTPEKARRTVRVGGVVLILLALACLYAILEYDGGPVDAVGF